MADSEFAMSIRQASRDDKRVVVVEDDPSVAMLIAAILSDEGYTPFVVMDGRQALQAVHEVRPRVVTLDLELPGVDGRAVLRRLVRDEQAGHAPVVVISANTDELSTADRRLVKHALRKPFNLIDLVEAVDDVAIRAAS
jgi:CheY-like chemotaxis protein